MGRDQGPSVSGLESQALVWKFTDLRSRFVLGSFVAGVADPGRGAERLFGMGPAAKKRIRSWVLRDVAWESVVETGASVPGYSGGANASPNVFLAGDRLRRSGFGAIVLRDVA